MTSGAHAAGAKSQGGGDPFITGRQVMLFIPRGPESRLLQCLSFPREVQCPCDLGRSCPRLSMQLASTALSHQSVEKMQVYLTLLLISYLLTPIGASILGRCVVAKRLRDGGLNYFEGYSLENCE